MCTYLKLTTRNWNYRGLTTENNKDTKANIDWWNVDYSAVVLGGVEPDFSDYGKDEGDTLELQTMNKVVVPESPIETSKVVDHNLQQILQTTTDNEHCIQKYLSVFDFVGKSWH